MSCKSRGPLGATRTRRIWNDRTNAVDEYLQGFVMSHPGTVVMKNCRAVLRKDYNEIVGKVKLVSGGGAGNEPTHVGFVGPGMLTGAVVGDLFTAPPSESILRVIRELGAGHTPGVLIIVQNYTGYRINFGIAKSRAQNEGLIVGMILVGDDTCLKSFEQTAGRRGLAGTLFVHKIAGAMAEEGKRLDEICAVCNDIINFGGIASIGISTRISSPAGVCSCVKNSLDDEEMELGLGIHGESGVARTRFATAKETVSQLLDIVTNGRAETEFKFADPDNSGSITGNEIALIINNLGGSSQMELGIFTKEVIEQLIGRGSIVERIYTGTLMTSLDTCGFQISLLKLASDKNLKEYLDAPTAAPAWPKVLNVSALDPNWNRSDSRTNSGTEEREYETREASFSTSCPAYISNVEPFGPVLDDRTAQVFLIVLSFSCEALISCAEQLNIMDEDSGDGDCGTSLARGAGAIKSAIKERQIVGSRPFSTLRQISYVIERVMGGIMGGLYSLFFEAGAKEFAKRSEKDTVDVSMWLDALSAGNKAVIEYGQATVGDRTMLDPLLTAEDHLREALKMNLHPIRAFGDAVKAAESKAIETIKMPARVGRASLVKTKRFEYSDPGAHAVGIWLRAAYEGVKLKLSCQC